jgi:hypothetical protein
VIEGGMVGEEFVLWKRMNRKILDWRLGGTYTVSVEGSEV